MSSCNRPASSRYNFGPFNNSRSSNFADASRHVHQHHPTHEDDNMSLASASDIFICGDFDETLSPRTREANNLGSYWFQKYLKEKRKNRSEEAAELKKVPPREDPKDVLRRHEECYQAYLKTRDRKKVSERYGIEEISTEPNRRSTVLHSEQAKPTQLTININTTKPLADTVNATPQFSEMQNSLRTKQAMLQSLQEILGVPFEIFANKTKKMLIIDVKGNFDFDQFQEVKSDIFSFQKPKQMQAAYTQTRILQNTLATQTRYSSRCCETQTTVCKTSQASQTISRLKDVWSQTSVKSANLSTDFSLAGKKQPIHQEMETQTSLKDHPMYIKPVLKLYAATSSQTETRYTSERCVTIGKNCATQTHSNTVSTGSQVEDYLTQSAKQTKSKAIQIHIPGADASIQTSNYYKSAECQTSTLTTSKKCQVEVALLCPGVETGTQVKPSVTSSMIQTSPNNKTAECQTSTYTVSQECQVEDSLLCPKIEIGTQVRPSVATCITQTSIDTNCVSTQAIAECKSEGTQMENVSENISQVHSSCSDIAAEKMSSKVPEKHLSPTPGKDIDVKTLNLEPTSVNLSSVAEKKEQDSHSTSSSSLLQLDNNSLIPENHSISEQLMLSNKEDSNNEPRSCDSTDCLSDDFYDQQPIKDILSSSSSETKIKVSANWQCSTVLTKDQRSSKDNVFQAKRNKEKVTSDLDEGNVEIEMHSNTKTKTFQMKDMSTDYNQIRKDEHESSHLKKADNVQDSRDSASADSLSDGSFYDKKPMKDISSSSSSEIKDKVSAYSQCSTVSEKSDQADSKKEPRSSDSEDSLSDDFYDHKPINDISSSSSSEIKIKVFASSHDQIRKVEENVSSHIRKTDNVNDYRGSDSNESVSDGSFYDQKPVKDISSSSSCEIKEKISVNSQCSTVSEQMLSNKADSNKESRSSDSADSLSDGSFYDKKPQKATISSSSSKLKDKISTNRQGSTVSIDLGSTIDNILEENTDKEKACSVLNEIESCSNLEPKIHQKQNMSTDRQIRKEDSHSLKKKDCMSHDMDTALDENSSLISICSRIGLSEGFSNKLFTLPGKFSEGKGKEKLLEKFLEDSFKKHSLIENIHGYLSQEQESKDNENEIKTQIQNLGDAKEIKVYDRELKFSTLIGNEMATEVLDAEVNKMIQVRQERHLREALNIETNASESMSSEHHEPIIPNSESNASSIIEEIDNLGRDIDSMSDNTENNVGSDIFGELEDLDIDDKKVFDDKPNDYDNTIQPRNTEEIEKSKTAKGYPDSDIVSNKKPVLKDTEYSRNSLIDSVLKQDDQPNTSKSNALSGKLSSYGQQIPEKPALQTESEQDENPVLLQGRLKSSVMRGPKAPLSRANLDPISSKQDDILSPLDWPKVPAAKTPFLTPIGKRNDIFQPIKSDEKAFSKHVMHTLTHSEEKDSSTSKTPIRDKKSVNTDDFSHHQGHQTVKHHISNNVDNDFESLAPDSRNSNGIATSSIQSYCDASKTTRRLRNQIADFRKVDMDMIVDDLEQMSCEESVLSSDKAAHQKQSNVPQKVSETMAPETDEQVQHPALLQSRLKPLHSPKLPGPKTPLRRAKLDSISSQQDEVSAVPNKPKILSPLDWPKVPAARASFLTPIDNGNEILQPIELKAKASTKHEMDNNLVLSKESKDIDVFSGKTPIKSNNEKSVERGDSFHHREHCNVKRCNADNMDNDFESVTSNSDIPIEKSASHESNCDAYKATKRLTNEIAEYRKLDMDLIVDDLESLSYEESVSSSDKVAFQEPAQENKVKINLGTELKPERHAFPDKHLSNAPQTVFETMAPEAVEQVQHPVLLQGRLKSLDSPKLPGPKTPLRRAKLDPIPSQQDEVSAVSNKPKILSPLDWPKVPAARAPFLTSMEKGKSFTKHEMDNNLVLSKESKDIDDFIGKTPIKIDKEKFVDRGHRNVSRRNGDNMDNDFESVTSNSDISIERTASHESNCDTSKTTKRLRNEITELRKVDMDLIADDLESLSYEESVSSSDKAASQKPATDDQTGTNAPQKAFDTIAPETDEQVQHPVVLQGRLKPLDSPVLPGPKTPLRRAKIGLNAPQKAFDTMAPETDEQVQHPVVLQGRLKPLDSPVLPGPKTPLRRAKLDSIPSQQDTVPPLSNEPNHKILSPLDWPSVPAGRAPFLTPLGSVQNVLQPIGMNAKAISNNGMGLIVGDVGRESVNNSDKSSDLKQTQKNDKVKSQLSPGRHLTPSSRIDSKNIAEEHYKNPAGTKPNKTIGLTQDNPFSSGAKQRFSLEYEEFVNAKKIQCTQDTKDNHVSPRANKFRQAVSARVPPSGTYIAPKTDSKEPEISKHLASGNDAIDHPLGDDLTHSFAKSSILDTFPIKPRNSLEPLPLSRGKLKPFGNPLSLRSPDSDNRLGSNQIKNDKPKSAKKKKKSKSEKIKNKSMDSLEGIHDPNDTLRKDTYNQGLPIPNRLAPQKKLPSIGHEPDLAPLSSPVFDRPVLKSPVCLTSGKQTLPIPDFLRKV